MLSESPREAKDRLGELVIKGVVCVMGGKVWFIHFPNSLPKRVERRVDSDFF